ncbi:tetratricopeptide repeat protein [Tepidibacter hydrothermalis]|uniref:Tetratricopeptide repeat protein n=1 Tax=Tepidibacter hydrothermalis TaxID=3036126 RepID=A0ABY8EHM4_9FIRM|nr:hypothetical protein [Tepidibacter hydrothermalis]WFD12431.1 hypothetical protein P4S50_20065 [Tepidibacter hydrothermalis]
MFLPAFASMFWSSKWRLKTDWVEKHYLKAYKFYTSKKYDSCIPELDKVLEHPNANKDLELLKAECYSNLGNSDMAYRIYKKYFESIDISILSASDYWAPKASAIELLVNKKDFDLALVIAQSLPEEKFNGFDFSLWKNHMKGMCFLGKDQYEVALECFKTAVGRKRSMNYPYIDCHYFISFIYAKLGKKGLAKKKFQRVYAADPTYKNVSDFMDAIESDSRLNISLL